LTTRVARPDLLLIGALLHDIGKGRDEDHSVVGEQLALQVGSRLGLAERDVRTVAAMVRHHLLLPDTATRRDLDDEATISRVVDTLNGDAQLVELLGALAEADSLATGPGVWTPFKRTLVADLVSRCRARMAGDPLPEPAPLDDLLQELADRVEDTHRPQVRLIGHPERRDAAEGEEPATVLVATPDRPGGLATIAGVLALHSLEVHVAEVRAQGGTSADAFTVTPRFGRLPDPAVLRDDLARALDGTLNLDEALAHKERDYARPPTGEEPVPPRVLWFDDEATEAVVLELRGTDRIGLLYRVASALAECGVTIRWAKVATLGASVVDSFCLDTPNGPSDLTRGMRQKLEQAVLTAVS
jgi:[protein-PII] uridylyltransferase